ncbi:MAG: hypothetical protein ABI921_02105 [Panacibacter sp.]
MQRFIRSFFLIILVLTITSTSYAQNILWLQGTWNGKAYLPGSKARQLYNIQLIISNIKGNKFEGIIKSIQPSDTSVHFDSKISGIVYEKYLIINRNKIIYVKDPADAHWQLSCNNCKPPHMIFSMENGKFSFSGEVKDCFSTCNGISEFSKATDELDTQGKESLFAFVNNSKIAEPGSISFTQNITPAPADTLLANGNTAIELRIAVLPAGQIVLSQHSKALSVSSKPPVLLNNIPSLKIAQNTFPEKRIALLPAGNIIKVKRQAASIQPQKPVRLLQENGSLTVKQNNKIPLPKKPFTVDTIVALSYNNVAKVVPKVSTELIRDTVALLPAGYNERKKEVVKTITVNTDSVTLIVYDNGIVDGDIVSVVYNNKVVIDKLSLTTRALTIKIPVTITGINTLVFHAHNLGEFPPNTAKLEILYGNKKEELLLSSDYTVSSAINIIRQ